MDSNGISSLQSAVDSSATYWGFQTTHGHDITGTRPPNTTTSNTLNMRVFDTDGGYFDEPYIDITYTEGSSNTFSELNQINANNIYSINNILTANVEFQF